MRALPWHRPLAIALSLVAAHVAGRAAFAGGVPDYRDVPRVTATDPAYFRARLAAAEQSVVRVAMFGDSQETAPWGWGEHYIAQLNARFARVFGPAGESQLFTNHTATSRPYWLGTMVEHAAAAPSALPDSAVLPSLAARALPAGGWSRTVFLHDASRCAHPPLQDGPWFDRTGPFVAEVLAVARAGAAPLAWRNAPVDGDEPDPLAPVVQSGFFAANPKDPKLGFLWRATPALSFAGRRHLQIALAGEPGKVAPEVVGVRFRSLSAHRGLVLQSFAAGGMRLSQLMSEHGGSGAMLRALAPSVAVIHYGANDVGVVATTEAWRSDLLASIAWIRAAMQDPAFPVVIAAELRTDGDAALLDLRDRFPVVAHEIALADSRVLALNLRRVTEEEYGWGRSRRYLADSAHFQPYAQRMLAEAFVGELTRALGLHDPSCAAPNWADCVRAWGASCQQGGCVLEPDFEVLEHGLPWQGAGTDCSDADGDGFSDQCPPAGPGDFNLDGFVDAADLSILLGSWGGAGSPADLDASGAVDAADLAMFLALWGA